MRRLYKEEKNEILKFLKEKRSLNYISKATGRPKTTIYYYMEKINGKKYLKVRINEKHLDLVGEVIGVFAGDGSFYFDPRTYHYKIYFFFNVKEEEYVKEFMEVLFKVFSKHPYKYRQKNVLILSYISKDIYLFLKKYLIWGKPKKCLTITLKEKRHDKEFKEGFLRGLWDSDGYVTEKDIKFGSVSKRLAKDALRFLGEFKIESRYYTYKDKRQNRAIFHRIDIKDKENRIKFIQVINPRNIKNAPTGN